eukprot:2189791-Prymnesium_polylepis.2
MALYLWRQTMTPITSLSISPKMGIKRSFWSSPELMGFAESKHCLMIGSVGEKAPGSLPHLLTRMDLRQSTFVSFTGTISTYMHGIWRRIDRIIAWTRSLSVLGTAARWAAGESSAFASVRDGRRASGCVPDVWPTI